MLYHAALHFRTLHCTATMCHITYILLRRTAVFVSIADKTTSFYITFRAAQVFVGEGGFFLDNNSMLHHTTLHLVEMEESFSADIVQAITLE